MQDCGVGSEFEECETEAPLAFHLVRKFQTADRGAEDGVRGELSVVGTE